MINFHNFALMDRKKLSFEALPSTWFFVSVSSLCHCMTQRVCDNAIMIFLCIYPFWISTLAVGVVLAVSFKLGMYLSLNGVLFLHWLSQEGLAAVFGNGLSTACVVNMGAQVTSVICVEVMQIQMAPLEYLVLCLRWSSI